MNTIDDASLKALGVNQTVASASAVLSPKSSGNGVKVEAKADSSLQAKESPDKADLSSQVREMNASLAAINHQVQLHVDQKTQTVQAVILDADKKVVLKIPSDELLKLSASLKKGNVALDKSV